SRISLEIELRDLRFGAGWADELRQLRRNVPRVRQEQLAARVHQTILAPARDCDVLSDEHAHAIRPAALDARAVDPRDGFERRSQSIEIDREESGAAERRDHFFDLHRRDALELAADFDLADRPIECGRESPQHDADADQHAGDAEHRLQAAGDDRLEPGEREAAAATLRLASIALAVCKDHGLAPDFVGALRDRLVSRIRHTRSSNSMPKALAPFGTSEWLVMPGAVFTSSR